MWPTFQCQSWGHSLLFYLIWGNNGVMSENEHRWLVNRPPHLVLQALLLAMVWRHWSPALFPIVWCETDLCFWLALKLNFTVTQIGKQAQYMQPVTTQLQMKFGMWTQVDPCYNFLVTGCRLWATVQLLVLASYHNIYLQWPVQQLNHKSKVVLSRSQVRERLVYRNKILG